MEVISYTVTHENGFLKKIISDLLGEAQVPFANSYLSLSPSAPPGMTVVTSLARTLPDFLCASVCPSVPIKYMWYFGVCVF